MTAFQTFVQLLQERHPPPPLFPTEPWDKDLSRQIQQSDLGGASKMTEACRAGLLLWNDDLTASHEICQGLDDATGSFWHAVMHRREGDAANSNYWWRRTGSHPAFAEVYTAVLPILPETPEATSLMAVLKAAGTWQPERFVAICDQARQAGTDPHWLTKVQLAEMTALLEWCRKQSNNL